ncbi:Trypsin-like peptidase domain-containing protein [Cupriavidus sp. YR651]|uniref:S1 family peptidase n=1 Tax=Cupriavidus sp. YR651 TaxID=1855315 RepID=UPI00088E9925|nr:serine protease [Cupriavidus sp. YR651]SDD87376.1 Trypsin-like peptidase domain-containing protein [Cupriavidus sp. YR651]
MGHDSRSGALRRRLRFGIAALAGMAATGHAVAMEPAAIFEKRAASVWTLNVLDAQGQSLRNDSAIVIGPDQLVTACDALARGKSISVSRERTVLGARLVHADVERDVCLIEAKGLPAPAVQIAPAGSLRVGQRVIAIGASGRDLTLGDGLVATLDRDDAGNIKRIGLTAALAQRAGGGGVFDMEGRLVGVRDLDDAQGQRPPGAVPAAWIAEAPTRAVAALAAFRAANVAAAAAPAPASPSGSSRRLTGSELSAHVAKLGRITVYAPSGTALNMNFAANGGFSVENTRTRQYSGGRVRVAQDANEVCLLVSNPKFDDMHACYRVLKTGETFRMQSVASPYHFTYARGDL